MGKKSERKSKTSTTKIPIREMSLESKSYNYALDNSDMMPRPCICGEDKLRAFLCDTGNKTVSGNPVFAPCLIREGQQVVLAVNKEDAERHLQNLKPTHAVLIVYKGRTSKHFGACMSSSSAIQNLL